MNRKKTISSTVSMQSLILITDSKGSVNYYKIILESCQPRLDCLRTRRWFSGCQSSLLLQAKQRFCNSKKIPKKYECILATITFLFYFGLALYCPVAELAIQKNFIMGTKDFSYNNLINWIRGITRGSLMLISSQDPTQVNK